MPVTSLRDLTLRRFDCPLRFRVHSNGLRHRFFAGAAVEGLGFLQDGVAELAGLVHVGADGFDGGEGLPAEGLILRVGAVVIDAIVLLADEGLGACGAMAGEGELIKGRRRGVLEDEGFEEALLEKERRPGGDAVGLGRCQVGGIEPRGALSQAAGVAEEAGEADAVGVEGEVAEELAQAAEAAIENGAVEAGAEVRGEAGLQGAGDVALEGVERGKG